MKRSRRKTSSLALFGSRMDARLAALLAAFVIALGGGLPGVAVWAAPVVQTPTATMVGSYQSDVLPTPDSTGLVVSLTLNEDGSAALTSDYLNDDAPIVEVGQWVQNEDGSVTLTVTGTAEQDYSQSIELTFEVNESGALVIPGEANGPFGEAGLVLAPADLSAAMAEEETSEAAPVVDLSTLPDNARVYQSQVLPSASTSGLQITLILFADGTLEMVSDYQDPGQIVIEMGTWAEADDGTVIVTLTGQLERNYEAPVELAFTTGDSGALSLVDEDGLLFGEDGLTLTPLTGEEDAAAMSEEAPAEIPEATPTALAEETVEAEAPITVTETLTETTAEIPPVATPEAEAETTPVASETITSTEEVAPVATPTSEAAIDDEAVDDEAMTDEVMADEEMGEAAMMVGAPDGPFVSDLLPAADASGFFQVAVFYPNGDVMLSSYFLNGEPPVVEVGRWEASTDGMTETVAMTDTMAITDTMAMTDTVPDTVTDTMTDTVGDVMSDTASMTYTVILSGTVDEAYENPVTIQMIALAGGALELDGVTLYPLPTAKLDSMTPGVVAEFESDVLPAASGPGLQIRLTLFDDSSLEMISDFQEPGEVVNETGDWSIDDEGNLVVTLTGQDDQAYEEPVTLLFAVGDDNTLTLLDDEGLFGDDGLTLLSVPVEPEAVDEGTEEDAEAAMPSEPLPAQLGLYQSELLPAASSPGLQVSVALLEDDAVAMEYDYQNDEEVVTQVGTWVDNGDGTVTLTLTEGPNGTFDEPVIFTLAVGEETMTIIEASETNSGLIDVELDYLPLE